MTVERLRDEDLLDETEPVSAGAGGLGRRRHVAGLALLVIVLPLVTLLLDVIRTSITLETVVLVYLLAVVGLSAVGGAVAAVPGAVAAALLINYFFVPPRHTLHIDQAEQAAALGVFVVVALVVSAAFELASRRARLAAQAAEHAEAMFKLAGGDLDEESTLADVLDHARRTFGMETVTLKTRPSLSEEWVDVERSGWAPPGQEAPVRFDVAVAPRLRLVGRGPALFAEDQRVLKAFGAAAETAYEGRRLSAAARAAESLAAADRLRVGLLGAVGHDLRTPLAGIKASVSGLRQPDVEWSDAERDELLGTIEQAADRLERVVVNLLDASRLEAGALAVRAEPIALDEVVGAALLAVPGAGDRIAVDVAEDLPLVHADPGLLERVVANLVDNAVRHATGPVRIVAVAGGTTATLEIIDNGPGLSAEQRAGMFQPFRDGADGVGLGLSIANGFVEAMGGSLVADRSPRGGLTMRMRLPLEARA